MPNPKGKALIKAFLALPKEAFADAAPPTATRDWEDADVLVPPGSESATKRLQRRAKAELKLGARSEPVRARRVKRA